MSSRQLRLSYSKYARATLEEGTTETPIMRQVRPESHLPREKYLSSFSAKKERWRWLFLPFLPGTQTAEKKSTSGWMRYLQACIIETVYHHFWHSYPLNINILPTRPFSLALIIRVHPRALARERKYAPGARFGLLLILHREQVLYPTVLAYMQSTLLGLLSNVEMAIVEDEGTVLRVISHLKERVYHIRSIEGRNSSS
ncbi:hypothetical protein BDV06DRAFT_203185, partial [Aspergillus oleicola]